MKNFIIALVSVCLLSSCGVQSENTPSKENTATENSLFNYEEFYPLSDEVTAHYTMYSYGDDMFLFKTQSAEMYLEYLSTIDESQVIAINITSVHIDHYGDRTTYYITFKSLDASPSTIEE